MGLFKKRAKDPIHVGDAICLLLPDRAFMRQDHHAQLPAYALAALAPITWAVRLAAFSDAGGPDRVSRLLHELTSYADAASMNASLNPGGVFSGSPNQRTDDMTGAVGRFFILPTSELTGTWQVAEGGDHPGRAERVYAALWHGAAVLDQEREVLHAVAALSGSFDETRGFAPGAELLMPQMLFSHGAEMAGMDRLKDSFFDDTRPDLADPASPPGAAGDLDDWVATRSSAGGFTPGSWHAFTHGPDQLVDGTWQSLHSASTDGLAIGFRADSGAQFLWRADEIRSATVAAKGTNYAVEVSAADGDFVCVGPRGRIREIFSSLGIEL